MTMKQWTVEVSYEWDHTYTVFAEDEDEAVRMARLEAKEDLADDVEAGVSAHDLDVYVLVP